MSSRHTREVKFVRRIKLETTSCWEKRSSNRWNWIWSVRSWTFKRSVTVRVMMMMMMKVVINRRRRRVGGRSVRISKRKFEEIPNLRFGVKFGFSYGHGGCLSVLRKWWKRKMKEGKRGPWLSRFTISTFESERLFDKRRRLLSLFFLKKKI